MLYTFHILYRNSALLHALAEKGHNLTILSVDLPRSHENVPANAHYIHLEKAYDVYKEDEVNNTETEVDLSAYIDIAPLKALPMFYDYSWKTVSLMFQSKGLQQLLSYPRDFKFDLIICDYSNGPYLLAFAHYFNKPPIIGISAFHNPPITLDFMSNHYFPAYVPFHSTSYSPKMNFWQRFHNTLIFALDIM